MYSKSVVFLGLTIATIAGAHAQSASDFEKNPKHRLALDQAFTNRYEGLVFRRPSTMPDPMKFSIGDYKTSNPRGGIADEQVTRTDKGRADIAGAIINALINKRMVTDYHSQEGTSKGSQRYAIDLTLEGYNNKLAIQANVVRFFEATSSTTGTRGDGEVETSIQVNSDTAYIVGLIEMEDGRKTWTIEIDYVKSGPAESIRGKLYNDSITYHVTEQLFNKQMQRMVIPGLIIKDGTKTIGATDFPRWYGGKGAVMFAPDLAIEDRQAMLCLSALFFGYSGIVKSY